MDIDIVTKEDLKRNLQEFRAELLSDLTALFNAQGASKKEWLKSDEVRKLLKISPGTLQTLRINGKLNPSKIGGIHFYKYDEIESLLDGKDNKKR